MSIKMLKLGIKCIIVIFKIQKRCEVGHVYSLESIKDSTQNFCKLDCMLFSFEMSVRELFSIFLVLDTKFFIVLLKIVRAKREQFLKQYMKNQQHTTLLQFIVLLNLFYLFFPYSVLKCFVDNRDIIMLYSILQLIRTYNHVAYDYTVLEQSFWGPNLQEPVFLDLTRHQLVDEIKIVKQIESGRGKKRLE